MTAINERLLRSRHRDRLRALGVEIRHMREDAGLSQATIARVAGVSAGHLSEVEAGEAEPSLLILERVGLALGADLGVRYFPNTGPRIRDRFQVPMVEEVLRTRHSRWAATPEVAVYKPVHGVIDLVPEDRGSDTTVETEFHSQLRRIEQQIRWQIQKADALAATPDQQGRHVSRLLVLRNTMSVRDAVRAGALVLAASYPARTADAVAALCEAAAWPGAAIIWMTIDDGRARLLDGPPRGIGVGR